MSLRIRQQASEKAIREAMTGPQRRKTTRDKRLAAMPDPFIECRLERRHALPPVGEMSREFVREPIAGTRYTIDTVHLSGKCSRCGSVVRTVRDRYTGKRLRGVYDHAEDYRPPAGTGPIEHAAVWGEYVRRFMSE